MAALRPSSVALALAVAQALLALAPLLAHAEEYKTRGDNKDSDHSDESVNRGYGLIVGMVMFVVVASWIFYITSDQYKVRKRMIRLGYIEGNKLDRLFEIHPAIFFALLVSGILIVAGVLWGIYHFFFVYLWKWGVGAMAKEDWELHHEHFTNKEYQGKWTQNYHELPDEISLLPKGKKDMPVFAHTHKDFEHAVNENEYLRFGGKAREERMRRDKQHKEGEYKTQGAHMRFWDKCCHLFFHSGPPRKDHVYHEDPKHKKNLKHVSNHLGFSHENHTHAGLHEHVKQTQIKNHEGYHPYNKDIIPVLTGYFKKVEMELMNNPDQRKLMDQRIKLLAIKYVNQTRLLFQKLEKKYGQRVDWDWDASELFEKERQGEERRREKERKRKERATRKSFKR